MFQSKTQKIQVKTTIIITSIVKRSYFKKDKIQHF